jgi:hypothetical protein
VNGRLDEILMGRGLVTASQIQSALQRQLTEGGRLGDNLVAIGALTADQLSAATSTAPPVPAGLAETGIPARSVFTA